VYCADFGIRLSRQEAEELVLTFYRIRLGTTRTELRGSCLKLATWDIAGVLIFEQLNLANRGQLLPEKHRQGEGPIEEKPGRPKLTLLQDLSPRRSRTARAIAQASAAPPIDYAP
jgi:hypothetical protein